jgi:hypothetical protein
MWSEHGVKMTAVLGGLHQGQGTYSSTFFGVTRNERGRDPLAIGCQVWTGLFTTVTCVRVDQNV